MHDGHDHGSITPTPPVSAYGSYLDDGPTPIANYGFNPTTVTVKDGNWHDPTVWSHGVPTQASVINVNHMVKIEAVSVSGDLNGDGILDVNDYLAWDKTDIPTITRFLDDYFGLAANYPGEAVADSCLITPEGCLSVYSGASLLIGTVQVLGCFELFGGDLIFRNQPFDYQKDAMQWGHGLIVHSGGSCVSRGGRVYSEDPAGVRGHFAILHSGTADLEGTEFFNLGRTLIGPLDNTQIKDGIVVHVGTNQMARYGGPHFHHCWGPANLPADVPQFRVVNCKIHDGTKWGITVHQSHFGQVEGNEIWACGGAGIAFEDGNEYGNIAKDNIIRDIFGDGKGQQGHNNGENVIDVGDGTPDNPYRTLGSHGNEGGGIWARGAANDIINNRISNCPIGISKWNRFNDGRKRPLAKGDTPSKYVTLEAGSQFDFIDSGNIIRECRTAAQIQGMVGVHSIIGLDVANCANGLDTSYNGTLRITDSMIIGTGTGWPMQPGFTANFDLVNNRVANWKSPWILDNMLSIVGGEYDAVSIRFKHVSSGQRKFVIDGAKITKLSYLLGDLNKNRDYGSVDIIIVRNFNGVAGDDFQLFFAEQAGSYVPKNLTDGNPRRVTPEPGLTNGQLYDKYGWRFGGISIPASAVTRPGVIGFCAPIPADLTLPVITERTATTTTDSITIRTKTDKPTRIRTEYAIGDIKLGVWPLMSLPGALATEHEVTISGLKPKIKYSYRQPAVDAAGNLGGDTRSSGINYNVLTATTK